MKTIIIMKEKIVIQKSNVCAFVRACRNNVMSYRFISSCCDGEGLIYEVTYTSGFQLFMLGSIFEMFVSSHD